MIPMQSPFPSAAPAAPAAVDAGFADLLQAALSGWSSGPVAALEALIDRWEVRA